MVLTHEEVKIAGLHATKPLNMFGWVAGIIALAYLTWRNEMSAEEKGWMTDFLEAINEGRVLIVPRAE